MHVLIIKDMESEFIIRYFKSLDLMFLRYKCPLISRITSDMMQHLPKPSIFLNIMFSRRPATGENIFFGA